MRGTFPDFSPPAAVRPNCSQRIAPVRRAAGLRAASSGVQLRSLLLPAAPAKVP